MKRISAMSLVVALGVSGCAQMQEQPRKEEKAVSAPVGGDINCATGARLAYLAGNSAASGCFIGMPVSAFTGFEKSRHYELASAEQARRETLEAVAALPRTKSGQVAAVGELKTMEVTAVDRGRNQNKKITAFDSLTVDLPLSAKGTPPFNNAMAKLKTLAERVADERGASEIAIALTAADAKASKANMEGGAVNSPKGSPITVSKTIDDQVPKGMQRIKIKAGDVRSPV